MHAETFIICNYDNILIIHYTFSLGILFNLQNAFIDTKSISTLYRPCCTVY